MSWAGQEKRRNSASGRRGEASRPPSIWSREGTGKLKMPARPDWLWLLLVLAANFRLARLLMPGPYILFKEEVGKGNVQDASRIALWRMTGRSSS